MIFDLIREFQTVLKDLQLNYDAILGVIGSQCCICHSWSHYTAGQTGKVSGTFWYSTTLETLWVTFGGFLKAPFSDHSICLLQHPLPHLMSWQWLQWVECPEFPPAQCWKVKSNCFSLRNARLEVSAPLDSEKLQTKPEIWGPHLRCAESVHLNRGCKYCFLLQLSCKSESYFKHCSPFVIAKLPVYSFMQHR